VFLKAGSFLKQGRGRKGRWDEHSNRARENVFPLWTAKSQHRSAFQKIGFFRENQEKPDGSSFPATTSVENIPHFNQSAILGF
jgi:hypothetical protein